MTCPNHAKICFHPAKGETYRDVVATVLVLGGGYIAKEDEPLIERAYELNRGIHTPTHAFERFVNEMEVLAAKRVLEIR